jgi:hypothetical protein
LLELPLKAAWINNLTGGRVGIEDISEADDQVRVLIEKITDPNLDAYIGPAKVALYLAPRPDTPGTPDKRH